MKLDYVIWSPPYTDHIGGIVALSLLAHNLTNMGERAHLWCDSKHPDRGGTLLPTTLPLELENPVVIYPEIVIGNPLGARHVVRWLLNTPGVCGGDGVFGDDDLVFKYVDYFHRTDGKECHGSLSAWGTHFDQFVDRKGPRSGYCHAFRKGFYKPRVHHPSDSVCIDDFASRGGNAYLVDVFNSKEFFVCYDHATMLAAQAALCGCKTIVVPDGVHTGPEWRALAPNCNLGIAYGYGDEAAWESMGLVREGIRELERESLRQTEAFVEKCELAFIEKTSPEAA